MNMTTDVAKLRIARTIHAAEAALDEALLKQSQLLSTLVEARQGTGVAPFTGQESLMRVAKMLQSMLSTGGDLARVHGRLQDIGHELMADDGSTTPTQGMAEAASLAA